VVADPETTPFHAAAPTDGPAHVIAQRNAGMAAVQRFTAELKTRPKTTPPGMGIMPGGVRQYRG